MKTVYDSNGKQLNVSDEAYDIFLKFGYTANAVNEHKNAEDDFDSMTVYELKAYADEHEVELGSAIKKQDIITKIKAALA